MPTLLPRNKKPSNENLKALISSEEGAIRTHDPFDRTLDIESHDLVILWFVAIGKSFVLATFMS